MREAFGVLQMHPWEFDNYSLDEYRLKRDGYFEHYRRDKILDFDHLRIAVSQLMRLQVERRDQRKPIDAFIPDIYNRTPEPTLEERSERVKRILEKAKHIKPKKKVNG